MHNISNVIKDDIMHYFIHSPFTIICPMFLRIFLLSKYKTIPWLFQIQTSGDNDLESEKLWQIEQLFLKT